MSSDQIGHLPHFISIRADKQISGLTKWIQNSQIENVPYT